MAQRNNKEEDIKIYNFKFITTCNNLNIGNVVFDGKKVIIFEIETDTYQRAVEAMKNKYIAQFNGSKDVYNQFIRTVFGTEMIVEVSPADQIGREKVEIPNK